MSEERIQEIKDSINFQYELIVSKGIDKSALLFTDEEQELLEEVERLNNIIKELDKQNGELGADLSLIEDRINKTNWWLENMLKQATNNETRAIISGTLELLLGSDRK